MKTKIIILALIILNTGMGAQEYYNKTIPFDFGYYPLAQNLCLYNNKLLLPTLIIDNQSYLIAMENDSIEYKHYNFSTAYRPITVVNNSIYLYGKDRSKKKAIKLMKLDTAYNPIWVKTYQTNGESDFPGMIINLDDYIYISYSIDFNNGAHREIGIKKIDTLGNEIWSRNYNENDELAHMWDIIPSLDGNILYSSGVFYYDGYWRYGQLTKIDTSGNILWRTKGEEKLEDGATPVRMTELSDSSIVLSYKINKFDEYPIHTWNNYPTRLKWFNKKGKAQQDAILNVPWYNSVTLNQIERGRGDYFFAYGYVSESDRENDTHKNFYYGYIVKYSNSGDTIWMHKYQYNAFDSLDVFYTIEDIEELENGDILVLGRIDETGELGKIWLFKVNSDGCFGEDSCGVYQRTDVADLIESEFELGIYPNPVTDHIIVNLPEPYDWERWSIYDINGRKIKTGMIKPQKEVEISGLSTLHSGMYFMVVRGKRGKVRVGKFVVE